jgi:hypothetical protein
MYLVLAERSFVSCSLINMALVDAVFSDTWQCGGAAAQCYLCFTLAPDGGHWSVGSPWLSICVNVLIRQEGVWAPELVWLLQRKKKCHQKESKAGGSLIVQSVAELLCVHTEIRLLELCCSSVYCQDVEHVVVGCHVMWCLISCFQFCSSTFSPPPPPANDTDYTGWANHSLS